MIHYKIGIWLRTQNDLRADLVCRKVVRVISHDVRDATFLCEGTCTGSAIPGEGPARVKRSRVPVHGAVTTGRPGLVQFDTSHNVYTESRPKRGHRSERPTGRLTGLRAADAECLNSGLRRTGPLG